MVEIFSNQITGYLTTFLNQIIDQLTSNNIYLEFKLSDDELGMLISTVVTVVGVFLGLYFTALSAVAGNLFMRAPANLQRLFRRNREGGQYIETLVLTIIIGIYYLLLRSFDYNPGMIGPILMTFLALYAVVRFMALGWQTFYFIQLSDAGSTLLTDAQEGIDGASAGGFGWQRNYMQAFYRVKVKAALDTLKDLIDFGIESIKFSPQQFVEIASYTGRLLNYYVYNRKSIPTKSNWYAERYKHQNWLLASESEIVTSLNTGTSLRPNNVKDLMWFENSCLDVIIKLYEHLVDKGHLEQAHSTIEVLVLTENGVGSNFYVDIARMIIEKSKSTIEKSIIDTPDPTDAPTKTGQLAILDSYARLPTAQLLGLLKYIDKRDWDSILKEIRNTNFLTQKGIYKSKLPGAMLSNMETTSHQFKTEKAIEGKSVSPTWYIETLAIYQYSSHLIIYYDYLKSLSEDFYEAQIDKLIAKQKYIQAAHLTDCWVEYTNKLISLGQKIQELVDTSEELKKVKDLSWKTLDAVAEKEIVLSLNRRAIDKLAVLIPQLSSLPDSKAIDLPDYFGQAYTFGIEAAYEAARDNDPERLAQIFPSVFLGALAAYESIKKEVKGWAQDSQLIFSSEPIEDILSLSGFIKIYSELYSAPELWSICEKAWNDYLESVDAKAAIELMVGFSNYRDQSYTVKPRDGLRHHWDSQLNSKMNDAGLDSDRYSSPMFGREEAVPHSSILIKALARRYGMMPVDARNIFFTLFLSHHPSIANESIDFPDRRDLLRSMDRESESASVDEEIEDEE